MPPQSANVLVRMPDGSRWSIPRENLARAKERGAVEVTSSIESKPKEESLALRIGRGGALGVFHGLGIPETQQPITDLLKGLGHETFDPKSVARRLILGPYEAVYQGLLQAQDVGHSVKDIAKGTAEEKAHGVGSIAGQLIQLLGLRKGAKAAPLAESETLNLPRRMIQEVSDRGPQDVAEARSAAAKKAAEQTADFEGRLAKYREEAQAKIAETQAKRIEQSRAETARRSYQDLKDRYAEQAAKNLEQAEATERKSLDDRYAQFRKSVLGVSPGAPKGMLQADLGKVGQSIVDATDSLVKGSSASVPIFKDILGKLKDVVETPTGEMEPVEGQMVPVDDLRGYYSELNNALYERDLPYDVREALKEVQGTIDTEIKGAIEDAHGQGAVAVYDKLKADYNDYMNTWRDISSGSPLPRVWKLMKSPVASKMGVPVYRQIADVLLGKKGESSIGIIARKRQFGADPNIIGSLRNADARLRALPKPTAVKGPNLPNRPGEPNIEEFDPESFIREGVEKKIKSSAKWGSGLGLFWALKDLLSGEPAQAAKIAETIAILQGAKHVLTSEPVLRWLSKEGPQP